MKDDIYRFGLSGLVDPAKHPELAERMIEARTRLRERLTSLGMADLVEPFDIERYNHQATVGENLLFGVPTSRALVGRSLAEHAGFRAALDSEKLTDDLAAFGARIAETMVEIFRGLPPGHPLFEQFSFIGAEELPDYEAIMRSQARRASNTYKANDLTRLLALPLAYVEPRHRLGLLEESLENRLVKGRHAVRERLEKSADPGVEFYDADKVCPAAPLKDNLLFGRVNHNAANAQARIADAITGVVDEMGLRPGIEREGLSHQVGPAGRMLSAQQRASVNLVRCMVKRPDILSIDGALAPFGEAQRRDLTKLLLDLAQGRTVFIVLPNDREIEGFEGLIRFHEGKAKLEELSGEAARASTPQGEKTDQAGSQRVAGGVT